MLWNYIKKKQHTYQKYLLFNLIFRRELTSNYIKKQCIYNNTLTDVYEKNRFRRDYSVHWYHCKNSSSTSHGTVWRCWTAILRGRHSSEADQSDQTCNNRPQRLWRLPITSLHTLRNNKQWTANTTKHYWCVWWKKSWLKTMAPDEEEKKSLFRQYNALCHK